MLSMENNLDWQLQKDLQIRKARPPQGWKVTRREVEVTMLLSGLVFRQTRNQARVALNSTPLKDGVETVSRKDSVTGIVCKTSSASH